MAFCGFQRYRVENVISGIAFVRNIAPVAVLLPFSVQWNKIQQ